MVTDPIADLLTRIRNASAADIDTLEVPASRVKANIVKVLKEEGYIRNFRLINVRGKHVIRVYLKMDEKGNKGISALKRVSRPGRRVYVGADSIPLALNGAGTVVMSTPKGVITGREAKKSRVGGEVLCTVW